MNLIICTTPFQMFLAERIIELFPDEEFIFKVFTFTDNEKFRYYFDRVKSIKQVVESEYIYFNWEHSTKVKKFVYLITMKIKGYFLIKRGIKKIFIANIDGHHKNLHIYIYHILYKEGVILNTFDDGLANLLHKSFFYKEVCYPKTMGLILNFLCPNTDLNYFKNKSQLHYTVYSKFKNIIENTQAIDLFDKKLIEKKDNIIKNSIKILIGQPIYELSKDLDIEQKQQKNIEVINKVINLYHIDYYIPHPRETYQVSNVNYINTPLIFEDYLINELQSNSDTKYEIYSFFSSAVINCMNLPNIEIKILKPADLSKDVEDIYSVFRKNRVHIFVI